MSQFLNFAGNQGTTFKNHGTGGGTSFTLDVNATTNSVLLAIGGVLQEPGVDYTVSGATVTTTTSVTAGIEVFSWVLHKQGTAPVIQDNSVTGGKIALTSQAEGDIMYCNASGDWVRLAKGTAGQVLKQNSGLTAPEWGTDNGGALEYISNTTGDSVTGVEVTSGLDSSTYQGYKIFVHMAPDTAGQGITMQLSRASTWETTSGYFKQGLSADGAASAYPNADNGTFWRLDESLGLHASAGMWGEITLWELNGALYASGGDGIGFAMLHHCTTSSANRLATYLTGEFGDGGDIDGFRFQPTSGNITVWDCRLYGIKI